MWAWVVGDLFPGAVAEGLISADLSWLAVMKLALPVGVVSGLSAVFGPYKRRMW
jgi:spore maturation protein SpmA